MTFLKYSLLYKFRTSCTIIKNKNSGFVSYFIKIMNSVNKFITPHDRKINKRRLIRMYIVFKLYKDTT